MNVLILPPLLFSVAFSLRCRCTQSSGNLECIKNVCEVNDQPAACLMLNHEITGKHYACSQSDLPDGYCHDRKTKSGAIVNVCSCNNEDFCNNKIWPARRVGFLFDGDESDEDVQITGRHRPKDSTRQAENESQSMEHSDRNNTEGSRAPTNRSSCFAHQSTFHFVCLSVIIFFAL
ncbi:hypothetical protein AB6A40_000123 [Gnathostoma spinigerum]|uniref:Uncharacterized protein n=1 Tax=Gnathostoma spinigerum TaxID=75299 RepID=A0ABD6E7R0_9BILA